MKRKHVTAHTDHGTVLRPDQAALVFDQDGSMSLILPNLPDDAPVPFACPLALWPGGRASPLGGGASACPASWISDSYLQYYFTGPRVMVVNSAITSNALMLNVGSPLPTNAMTSYSRIEQRINPSNLGFR